MCRGVFLRISRCLAFLWRALLVYPGEIFRFHFPEALDEPNRIPTADAMHWALPTVDSAYAFPQVDETGIISAASPAATDCKSEPRETSKKDRVPLTLYASALARNLPRAKSVVRYIHVSALLAGTPKSLAISDSSNTVLGALCSVTGAACSTKPIGKALEGLLDSYDYLHLDARMSRSRDAMINRWGEGI